MGRWLRASVAALGFLSMQPAQAAWAPAGVDLSRPRILFRRGDLHAIQIRLDRQPYVRLMEEVVSRIGQADGVALDDHSIAAERLKARAAQNLAFCYAIDRTVIDDAVVPFVDGEAREAAAQRVRAWLLAMYTRSRLAVAPPLGGFDRDINTSEELQQYAVAYDTMRGAGYDFGADDAAIVANLVALASELYHNYVDPPSAFGFATLHQNNHRSKSGAALAMTAIAVAEYTPAPGSDPLGIREPARWFDYGIDQVDVMMRYVLLSGDGAYSEGPFYLRYASQNLLPFWRSWDRLSGGAAYAVGDVAIPSFWRHPLLARAIGWALDSTLPDGGLAPTDDGNVGLSFFFGNAPLVGVDAPAYLWRWDNAPRRYDTDASISLAPDAIVNHKGGMMPAAPERSPTSFYVDGGAAIFRSDWSDEAVLAIVQAEHDTASEFGRDRAGRGVAPQSHEHAEPGSFLLHAYGERLAIDPGYFTFSERTTVSQPAHHNMILIDGAGPSDYLLASLDWLQDPFARPPADGHAMLSHTLDAGGWDAARVTTRYGQPSARIERRFLFADDRYLAIADTVEGPAESAAELTWLLHGNGGGDSGGTFALGGSGARWQRPAAALDAGIAFDSGAPTLQTAEAVHEIEGRARATHTVLRASTIAAEARAIMLLYPSPAGAAPSPPQSLDLGPGIAALQLVDGDRRIVALHRAASSPLTVAGAPLGMRDVESDARFLLVDAAADGALNLAWAEDATHLTYDDTDVLSTETRGRLAVRRQPGEVEVLADVADPLVSIGGVGFTPQAADGACALLPGPAVVVGRERRVTLHAGRTNSAPAADPGPDRHTWSPVVWLDGGASCDADGDALTPQWQLIAAPAGSAWSLEDAGSWTPRLYVDRVGPFRVRLTVRDAQGNVSRPAEVLVIGGVACEDGLDGDLDGLFDSDDADCDRSAGDPIDGDLGLRWLRLRIGERRTFLLRDLFGTADGAELRFQAASTGAAVAGAAVRDGVLTVQGNRFGRARVVVTADDGREHRSFNVLDVTVDDSPACAGDCDGDGAVTVDEVLTGIAIALGRGEFERCPALDSAGNGGELNSDDLVRAVVSLLEGCPRRR